MIRAYFKCCLDEEIKFYPNSAKKDKRNQFEKDPWFAVFNVEENRVLITVRINGADNESCNQSAKKRAPQCFHREIVADLNGILSKIKFPKHLLTLIYSIVYLFQTEKNSTNWCSESNRYSRCSRCR